MKKILLFIALLIVNLIYSKEHVILLHGIGRSKQSMNKIEKKLKKLDYIVKNINYPSTEDKINEISDVYLKKIVDKSKKEMATKIHFVTHSMGGIVLRYFLQSHSLPNGSRIVMMAPPNHGSEISDLLKDWFIYQKIYGPAGQELGKKNKEFFEKLKPIEGYHLGIIAGDLSIEPWFSPFLKGNDDGKVSVESTKLDEMNDFIIFHNTHTFMMYDKDVINEITNFIMNGKFEHKK